MILAINNTFFLSIWRSVIEVKTTLDKCTCYKSWLEEKWSNYSLLRTTCWQQRGFKETRFYPERHICSKWSYDWRSLSILPPPHNIGRLPSKNYISQGYFDFKEKKKSFFCSLTGVQGLTRISKVLTNLLLPAALSWQHCIPGWAVLPVAGVHCYSSWIVVVDTQYLDRGQAIQYFKEIFLKHIFIGVVVSV